MKTKFYAVFDIQPVTDPNASWDLKTLEKIGQFNTELEALQHIYNTNVGYQLTILQVWE